ncbi:rRNA pseudouridine synthase [Candidatus Woesearchaeota archaeon]|nr:rRNA pseudouridine synthase [Candidatus Woesearchaeota archaeon]
MKQRLQKILAQAGIASRRKSEELIAKGRVTVNGLIASLGQSADPEKDIIKVNERQITLEKKVYIKLYKPAGFVSTVEESHGMPTIMDLVKSSYKIFPVGRLDKDTEGLMLLTNDGELANKIMHPRYGIEKEYIVRLNKIFQPIKKKVVVEGKEVNAKISPRENPYELLIKIKEGRKHIVKKYFEQIGYKVCYLKRISIGPLVLSGVKKGTWGYLTSKEKQLLLKL